MNKITQILILGLSMLINSSYANNIPAKVAQVGPNSTASVGIIWPNPRFVAGTGNGAACLIDKLTGLMWVKDLNFGLDGKAVTAISIDDASTQINKNLGSNTQGLCGYKDWRLPNIVELRSLINFEAMSNVDWLKSVGFLNVQPLTYRTNNWYSKGGNRSWLVNMATSNSGIEIIPVSDFLKINIWPVRGGINN